MKSIFKKAVFFSFLGISSAFSQTNLEERLQKIMEKYDAVGLSVVAVKKNTPVYIQALGNKNIESSEKLAANDLFRIASISKSFTSTAILHLVEQKKLKLSDDISDHIGFKIRNPKYPDTKITIEMILSHTSSLNDSQGYFNFDIIDPSKAKEWEKCYNNYAPGKDYEYCNLNFNLLGAVIEKLTKTRFDQYIDHTILKPLDIDGGYCVDSLDKKRFVTLYNLDNQYVASDAAYHPRREEIKTYTLGTSTPIFSPTGGMKISAPDLANYMIMHMNYGKKGKTRIINKKSAKRMQKPLSEKENYGLAFRKTNKLIPGVELVGHTGSAYGLYSQMFFNPKKKYGFVAITNGCKNCYSDTFNKLLQEVTQTLYSEYID